MPDIPPLPPISNTAFFCCGIRELDAESRYPICNDIYAKDFMTDEGRAVFEKYSPGYFAKGLNIVRPKIIDTLIASHLKENQNLKIVLIGAGFDSRAYRLAGGDWLEIDDVAIINHKNKCLPVDRCPNPLKRVPINYAEDSLADILKEHASSQEYLYVIEGVFMYLDVGEIESLLKAIGTEKSKHTLICDLMTHTLINTFARGSKKRFDEMGAIIKCQTDRPESIFFDYKYVLLDEISVSESAIKYGTVKFPKFLLLNQMRKGFRVMHFQLG